MSTAFDSMLAADSAVFVADFGETMTYRPRNGSTRQITAVVMRNPTARPDELEHGLAPSIEIVVRNDSTNGISSAELDTGGDAILLKWKLGDSADTPIPLLKPVAQDAGILTFRYGKR